jgi:hypothetical protein
MLSNKVFAYLLIHLHHTGSQKKALVAVQEKQTGSNPQETQAQEVLEVDKKEEDLPECVDTNPVPSNEASLGVF